MKLRRDSMSGSNRSRLVKALVTAGLSGALIVTPATALAKTFSDVPSGSWYYESVQYALDNHIFYGYPDGTFRPYEILPREQAAAVFYNKLGMNLNAPVCSQTDVDQNAWYHLPVNWAVAYQVMNGYSSETFGVGDSLTREQLACVVANAARADLSSQSTAILDSMPDGNQVSYWARKGVAWALEKGVIHGVAVDNGSRRIAPQETVNRATMAAIMMNADKAKLFEDEDVKPDKKDEEKPADTKPKDDKPSGKSDDKPDSKPDQNKSDDHKSSDDKPSENPDERPVPLCDSWATLYVDGELVFQKSDEVDTGRIVIWHGHGNEVHHSALCRLKTVKITSRCSIQLDDGDNHIEFGHFRNLTDISGLSLWDVSKVTNFDDMFYGCVSLDDLSPLDSWSVSSSLHLSRMFEHTRATLFPHWYII